MSFFSFGGEEHDRVEVQVHGYERAPVGEYYDDNWLRVAVRIEIGGFSGAYDAAFLTSELSEFRDGVRLLYESLTGTTRFSTIEGQLALELTGDGRGHVALHGVALDAIGLGNRLEFQIDLDPGHLSEALRGLDEIASSFPVRTSYKVDGPTSGPSNN